MKQKGAKKISAPMFLCNIFEILVPIQVTLEGTIDRDADVVGLFLGEFRQLDTNFGQVQAGHFLVEVLGQVVNAHLIVILPQIQLGHHLVGEGVAHHE